MDIQDIFTICNIVLTASFVICYIYQFFYIFCVFLGKDKSQPVQSDKLNKFGVIISARDEENVIGHLLESINRQDYPSELIKIFLIADNCTDNTAKIARELGAVCYERFDTKHRTKGYALQFLVENIRRDYGVENYGLGEQFFK